MRNGDLPPPPDAETGVPAPPAAPPHRGSGAAGRGANGPGGPSLAPPPGQGPVLAWRNPTWWKDGIRPAIMYVLAPLVVIETVYDQGTGWMANPLWWLLLCGIALLSVPFLRGRPLAAGATWFGYGRRWVNTYELVSIRVVAYYGFYSLKLEDADGHRISIQTGTIQENQFLWSLVYNGIVHSAHNGRLALDRLTRTMLELPVLHTDPPGTAAKPRLRSTVWALTPLFTFGLLTPFVVGHGARRLHSRRLALGAVAYALPIPVFLTMAVLLPTTDTIVEWATAAVLLGQGVAWLLGGLHAYRLRWRVFAAPRTEAARKQILTRR